MAAAAAASADASYLDTASSLTASCDAPIASNPFTSVSIGGVTTCAAPSPKRSRTAVLASEQPPQPRLGQRPSFGRVGPWLGFGRQQIVGIADDTGARRGGQGEREEGEEQTAHGVASPANALPRAPSPS